MIFKIKGIEEVIKHRTIELAEDKNRYFKIADELEKTGKSEFVKRAEFIRRQCNDQDAEGLFNKNREAWGIPYFNEDLITVDDFRNGFLYKFRDHTTTWSDNQEAKQWFLNSFEARFVQVYEFWSCDNGPDELIETRIGDFKAILKSLLKDGDFEVLKSPIFTKQELDDFVKTFKPNEGDFTIEEIIEDYIIENPNY